MENAVERRLAHLDALWNGLAEEPGVRLLRWKGSDPDLQLVRLHIDLQADRDVLSDLFLSLGASFECYDGYGAALAREIIREYEISAPALEQVDVLSKWDPPEVDEAPGFSAIVGTAESFVANFAGVARLLVLVLAPEEIADANQWKRWLMDACRHAWPACLRIMVLDRSTAPILDGIDEDLPGLARTIDPQLDADAAVDELARSEVREGPGKEFTLHFLAIGSAAAVGNVDAMRRSARAARAIAQMQSWIDQEIVVHAALGSGLLSTGRSKDAVIVFKAARALASKLNEQQHPAAPKLMIVTGMSEASARFASDDFDAAALVYGQTGTLAQSLAEHAMALEAWRMAAYCREREDKKSEAWRCCERALAAGELMDEAARQASTLLYVGEAMLRLLQGHAKEQAHVDRVHERMIGLLGALWRDRVQPAKAPA